MRVPDACGGAPAQSVGGAPGGAPAATQPALIGAGMEPARGKGFGSGGAGPACGAHTPTSNSSSGGSPPEPRA